MPEVIDADALAFAALRAAHLEPPRQVADDLLAAATSPAIHLKGVTPYQARMRAAKILIGAGDQAGAQEVLKSSRIRPEQVSFGARQNASALVTSPRRRRW